MEKESTWFIIGASKIVLFRIIKFKMANSKTSITNIISMFKKSNIRMKNGRHTVGGFGSSI